VILSSEVGMADREGLQFFPDVVLDSVAGLMEYFSAISS
jgi:hypothetical protein